MKISSTDEFVKTKAGKSGTKKKISYYATLPPAVAEICQGTDMTPPEVFLTVVNHIKAKGVSATQGIANAEEVETGGGTDPQTNERAESESTLLQEMGKDYADLLLFIWASYHLGDEMRAPTVMSLTNSESIEWEKETSMLMDPPPTSQVTPIDLTRNSDPQESTGTATAMTKLAESIMANQEASLKHKEEKSDPRMKAWTRLPMIQRNVILLGGVGDDGTIPPDPTEEMLSILGCQNGAQVDQYLRQSMAGHNINPEPGLCSALNKGILVHAEDGTTPRNFTPFLVPPVSDTDEVHEKSNLLRLAVQDKFSDRDVSLLTKQEVTIPMKAQELRHHMRNFAGLAGRCFGEDSLLFTNLCSVAGYIDNREVSYCYEFRQDRLFEKTQKLHTNVNQSS